MGLSFEKKRGLRGRGGGRQGGERSREETERNNLWLQLQIPSFGQRWKFVKVVG